MFELQSSRYAEISPVWTLELISAAVEVSADLSESDVPPQANSPRLRMKAESHLYIFIAEDHYRYPERVVNTLELSLRGPFRFR